MQETNEREYENKIINLLTKLQVRNFWHSHLFYLELFKHQASLPDFAFTRYN